MNVSPRNSARTFYLNEKHELPRGEKEGGGRLPKYAGIDWRAKGKSIAGTLSSARKKLEQSSDPMSQKRYFLLATPERIVQKESTDKRKAPTGVIDEETHFASKHSQVFRRLGIDLVQVNTDGTATVHATPDRVDQMLRSTSALQSAGAREQARWATIRGFDVIPSELRVDELWLEDLNKTDLVDAVVELQPLLTRDEAGAVGRSVQEVLQRRPNGEMLRGTGSDFSGRTWFRGRMTSRTIREIADKFYSVQSIHPPLLSLAAAKSSRSSGVRPIAQAISPPDPHRLPCVAVVDTGIPDDHRVLAAYSRGRYRDPDSAGRALGHHGSRVASRIVFGDHDFSAGLPETNLQGGCSFYDVTVCVSDRDIEDECVVRAMETVARVAPDIRVFNLSFDSSVPLAAFREVERRERLLNVQDLDNFAFANDVLIVVAAGNTAPGVQPSTPYPGHHVDTQWSLGAWARAFNALTCGSTVEKLHADGLVGNVGWPSPFTRLGLGLCDSPKPDYSANGGNFTPSYAFRPGLGVWSCNADGAWEDASGTSLAAPILSREAAAAFAFLQGVCEQGGRPYAVTVKAFLALTAQPPEIADAGAALAERALGRGKANARRLLRPLATSAVLLWQGVLHSPKDIAQVQVPIPQDWLNESECPRLRLIACWDSPVNAAAEAVWACRRLSAQLKPVADGRTLHGSRGSHRSYTTFDRVYDLANVVADERPSDDNWVMQLSYEQIAEYTTAIEFTPQQRVAFAIELYDASEHPVSPQSAIQALPVAESMSRLSIPPTALRNPLLIKARL